MGFLLSRRWVLFAVAVVLAAWAAWALGQWQFHRLDERKDSNKIVATNLNAPPVPVDDVLSPERAPSAEDEWRRVTVHGTWDDQHSVVLKYQTRDYAAGVDVVTPLVTDDGPAVAGRPGLDGHRELRRRPVPKLPAVTDGQVTVTGWVRRDATGGATKVSDLSTRAISSQRIAEVMPYPLYRGFLDLAAESPAPATSPGARGAARRHEQRPALLLRAPVVVLRGAGGLRLLLPAWDELRQRRSRARGWRPVRAPGACRRPRAASSR